ncbi:hypothetical protein BDF20DRAFT_927943 [Mycotypha africana]|uniref:uncharacterized protein n=1 Tax=Mycotypha africana TaxID=64632 RepID=UPI00230135DF|nr:uncharacterized protein BDF20DRAFT_927943 [Mycotypha africana]KAI8967569.1 hypothetical protein BDF20DRAFT_927943 [Mycotypha africana]
MKSNQSKPSNAPRKKKAARACIHCQKAHLTCDDSRPCQRCIKRNLANTCTDGARKKAKYLQDTDGMNIYFGRNYNSSITFLQQQSTTSTPLMTSSTINNTANMPFNNTNTNTPIVGTNSNNNSNNTNNINHPNITSISAASMDTSQVTASGISTLSAYGEGAVVANVVASPINNNLNSVNNTAATTNPTSSTTHTTAPVIIGRRSKNQIITPEMAYASATKPFSYADGYHYLINYVKTRMSREDLMRISRALALFRPSVLASMMNLTEDDLIFTEKCLQRTLLEYEKLISYSGTPTVVWRRTGEITLVGKEFSLLTQWSRDMLLSKKTYIYELMSNPSAVEYWEKYALHAFDNTDSAVYSTCILLSPTKRIVPCTFCFTIKRDIFDLPSVIIGNFLPILS